MELTTEKQTIQAAIDSANADLNQIEKVVEADNRIQELVEEKTKMAVEFTVTAKHLHLIERFIKLKSMMLTDSINSRFRFVKFELFQDLINGGVEPICEATLKGVPYGSLNNAGRIQAGLDIIETFGNFYHFRPVIFVDGRESVTEIPEMTAQVISLVVSPEDKKLRVVTA